MYSSEGVNDGDNAMPYFHPFSVAFEDPYAEKMDGVVKTYLQTRMVTPHCQTPFFVDHASAMEQRVCPLLSQRLVDPASDSFWRLRDALRPSKLEDAEATTPWDLIAWTAREVQREIEDAECPSHQEPLMEELVSVDDSFPVMLMGEHQLHALPSVSEGDHPHTLDQLLITSMPLASFGQLPPLDVVHAVARHLIDHVDRRQTSVEVDSDFTTTMPTCPSTSWKALLPADLDDDFCSRGNRLDVVTEWTDIFSPQTIERREPLQDLSSEGLITECLRQSLDLLPMESFLEMPVSDSKLVQRSSVADEVLCELLHWDSKSDCMASELPSIDGASASFLQLLVDDLMSDVDYGLLPPVVFEDHGLVDESNATQSQTWVQPRSVRHLEVYLDWNLGEKLTTRLDLKSGVQMETATEEIPSQAVDLKEFTRKVILSSVSGKQRTLLGSLSPLLRVRNAPIDKKQIPLDASMIISPSEECDVSYLMGLKRKRIDTGGGVGHKSSTDPSAQFESSHHEVLKTSNRYKKKTVRVELSHEIEDLLKRMYRKHQSILDQLPLDVRQLWGCDLMNVTSLSSVKPTTGNASIKGTFAPEFVLRQCCVRLKDLGVTASWLYMEEVSS